MCSCQVGVLYRLVWGIFSLLLGIELSVTGSHRPLKLRTDSGYARVRELGSNCFENEPIVTKF